ncbi:hypothetical protein BC938DRAFT_476082 [Jimgerdemannia flammicorona]|uniref:Uncharacterized protein n=1 Tax=Jimgerdemannia flammicorona TaxID=994334 RepID=A0A433PKL3_9FUNG|nr:hypothetical protein BC938DRAFT_476082 [Jimgerdemannia flammicorona]
MTTHNNHPKTLNSLRIHIIGHVLRFTPLNRRIKSIIDSGILGDILHIDHHNPVGFYHFAHSASVLWNVRLWEERLRSFAVPTLTRPPMYNLCL